MTHRNITNISSSASGISLSCAISQQICAPTLRRDNSATSATDKCASHPLLLWGISKSFVSMYSFYPITVLPMYRQTHIAPMTSLLVLADVTAFRLNVWMRPPVTISSRRSPHQYLLLPDLEPTHVAHILWYVHVLDRAIH